MADKKPDTEKAIVLRAGHALGQASRLALAYDMETYMESLDNAWPGDLTPDQKRNRSKKLIRQGVVTISQSPAAATILKCGEDSILDCFVDAASMDLNLSKAFGEAYLVPFVGACTLMPGYRGLIKLIVNTGFVPHVESVLHYAGEEFTFTRDEQGPHWHHVPDFQLQGQGAKVVGCYAVGYTRVGTPIFEYMNAAELEKVKQSSAAVRKKADTPYNFWPTEMMRKAPIRRLQKYLPKMADNKAYDLLAKAVEHDNKTFDIDKYQETARQFAAETAEAKQKDWAERMAETDEPKDEIPEG